MDNTLSELISRLNNSISNENFIDVAYELIEKIETRDDAYDAIEPILKLMENNPGTDFGQPGPLVHFVEKYYKKGYEERLIDSIRRCPTKHTLWMLNRIINGSEGNTRQYFLDILEEISHSPNIDTDVIETAKHFRTIHV